MKKVKPAITIENEELRKKIIHPPEKENELYILRLAVYAPYKIHDYQGTQIIAASALLDLEGDDSEYTIEEFKNKFDEPSFFNPFSEDSLLEEIANINITDENSILSFCNKYGLYGQSIMNRNFQPLLADPLKLEVKEEVLVNISESLDYFVENTYLIQLVIKIINEDIPVLEEKYKETKDKAIQEEISILKRAVTRLVNRGLRLVSPSINFLEDSVGFLPSYTSVCLLGAAYYHLHEAIVSGKEFRQCLFCKSLFVPRSPNGKYCPPTQIDKHGSCENNYNQLKFRARTLVRKKGKSIEEAAKSVKRPIEEVRGWFN